MPLGSSLASVLGCLVPPPAPPGVPLLAVAALPPVTVTVTAPVLVPAPVPLMCGSWVLQAGTRPEAGSSNESNPEAGSNNKIHILIKVHSQDPVMRSRGRIQQHDPSKNKVQRQDQPTWHWGSGRAGARGAGQGEGLGGGSMGLGDLGVYS